MSEHRPAVWTGRSGKRSVQAVETTPAPAEPQYDQGAETADASWTDDVDATDAAKAFAAQHGIDLSTVEGTGTSGRVTKDDVAALIDTE